MHICIVRPKFKTLYNNNLQLSLKSTCEGKENRSGPNQTGVIKVFHWPTKKAARRPLF